MKSIERHLGFVEHLIGAIAVRCLLLVERHGNVYVRIIDSPLKYWPGQYFDNLIRSFNLEAFQVSLRLTELLPVIKGASLRISISGTQSFTRFHNLFATVVSSHIMRPQSLNSVRNPCWLLPMLIIVCSHFPPVRACAASRSCLHFSGGSTLLRMTA